MSDASTPYLNVPTRSAERRALEIAVRALRAVYRDPSAGLARDCAGDALDDIRTLVPDAGEPE